MHAIRDEVGKIVGFAKWPTTTGTDEEPVDEDSQEWIDYLESAE